MAKRLKVLQIEIPDMIIFKDTTDKELEQLKKEIKRLKQKGGLS